MVALPGGGCEVQVIVDLHQVAPQSPPDHQTVATEKYGADHMVQIQPMATLRSMRSIEVLEGKV